MISNLYCCHRGEDTEELDNDNSSNNVSITMDTVYFNVDSSNVQTRVIARRDFLDFVCEPEERRRTIS